MLLFFSVCILMGVRMFDHLYGRFLQKMNELKTKYKKRRPTAVQKKTILLDCGQDANLLCARVSFKQLKQEKSNKCYTHRNTFKVETKHIHKSDCFILKVTKCNVFFRNAEIRSLFELNFLFTLEKKRSHFRPRPSFQFVLKPRVDDL